jgi:hypothetical protein
MGSNNYRVSAVFIDVTCENEIDTSVFIRV